MTLPDEPRVYWIPIDDGTYPMIDKDYYDALRLAAETSYAEGFRAAKERAARVCRKEADFADRPFIASLLEGMAAAPEAPPEIQMAQGNHSIGIFKDGKLIAADKDVYAAPEAQPCKRDGGQCGVGGYCDECPEALREAGR